MQKTKKVILTADNICLDIPVISKTDLSLKKTFPSVDIVLHLAAFNSTKDFYSSIGFSNYLAIDLNDKMNSIIMDLNRNFSSDYNFHKQFDLVTNIGTGEHVFDQKIVF
mgnify:CR=1 FL=1